MRNVIVTNITTLDGMYSGSAGNPMVLNMDASFDAYNLERMRAASTVLLGRSSFEMFSSHWPMVADAPEDANNPGLSDVNREFSRLYGDIPKLVVSDSLLVARDNPWYETTEVVSRTNIAQRLGDERDSNGADIVIFGSGTTWNGLVKIGLVDELHLIVGPSALGEGRPLFSSPVSLKLIEARTLTGSSNALLRYATR